MAPPPVNHRSALAALARLPSGIGMAWAASRPWVACWGALTLVQGVVPPALAWSGSTLGDVVLFYQGGTYAESWNRQMREREHRHEQERRAS